MRRACRWVPCWSDPLSGGAIRDEISAGLDLHRAACLEAADGLVAHVGQHSGALAHMRPLWLAPVFECALCLDLEWTGWEGGVEGGQALVGRQGEAAWFRQGAAA